MADIEKDNKRASSGFRFFAFGNKLIFYIVVPLVLIILAGLGGFLICFKIMSADKKPKVTAVTVSEKLEEVSELTTEKTIYKGYIHYEEGEIPFINKKSYTMTYTAEIEAGIDVSAIKVSQIGDGVVVVKLPDSDIRGVYVDPASIEFYDESFALFNWDSKEDGVEAISMAETDAMEQTDTEALKSSADNHAKELIYNLFKEAIEDGRVVIE